MNAPDSTAVRVALWRAMHVELDAPPHIFEDTLGLALAAPGDDWRNRPDMDPGWTRRLRAWMVTRSRFSEDLVEKAQAQYVILGAGLDTFAQRRPEIASRLHVFEVDRPGPQDWKRTRLHELGLAVPEWLHFVPVDFETGPSWRERLSESGFEDRAPAIVSCAGVTMYLTKEAVAATLRQIATLAPGSTVAMTFLVPLELVDGEDRAMAERAKKGASASGTPFVSYFAPSEMLALAREAGFQETQHVSGAALAQRYFDGRTDGLWPASGEDFLVARTRP